MTSADLHHLRSVFGCIFCGSAATSRRGVLVPLGIEPESSVLIERLLVSGELVHRGEPVPFIGRATGLSLEHDAPPAVFTRRAREMAAGIHNRRGNLCDYFRIILRAE